MPPKRLPAKDKPSRDDWQITDEWGIYDPAKAGMQALYARLGRPILSAAPTNARRERRRAARPERSSDGVGLAIQEARRRAGLENNCPSDVIPQSPARALRAALKTRHVEAAVEAVVDDAAPAAPVEPTTTSARAPQRRRNLRKATATEPPTAAAEPDAPPKARPAARGRRTKTAVLQPDATPVAAAATGRTAHPPAPSPRRPRGPVPLAAWAHAVNDQQATVPRPPDRRGFWRGVFRIPAEVALVEYAHGCRIQRLLIEAASDPVPDFI